MTRRLRRSALAVVALAAVLTATGCTSASSGSPTAAAPNAPDVSPTAGNPAHGRAPDGSPEASGPAATTTPPRGAAAQPAQESTRGPAAATLLPGMPPPLDPKDLYAANRPGQFAPSVQGMRPLVWVPNSDADTVSVIDPRTYRVVRTFRVGDQPHHVVPSWDLKTLWVNNTQGNTLTPIDPVTGRVGRPVAVQDPYNLYFTPDGKYAVVMASRDRQIVFRDPRTMAVRKTVPAGCAGVNHADFSADGRYFIVSCEFSGQLLKVDVAAQRVVGRIRVPGGGMPQDVKISPDGRTWYVADMDRHGVWVVDGDRFRVLRLLRTGRGAHGLYVSRDSRYLYVSNRDEGSVSRLEFATRRLVGTWRIPGGGSPDMGGVSADGRVLWLAGRYHGEVYALDTRTGRLIRRIRVGAGPHGLCVYPQPGRYSLGHTGILR